ncbi:hypothetical protein HELRODRAFT_160584 [Helobdella robusta]|uniref:HMG box domain-containing protein n=1 Tax=Helobdella robusta TaxID=6412 RepID=T1EQG3_HELRO|nr:hypothetical protein HELRODRAFT_160584 [Helobdella robusta]ESO06413.1 hypothetical protein HELRODRAFT_160584 [Helobdella robusta]
MNDPAYYIGIQRCNFLLETLSFYHEKCENGMIYKSFSMDNMNTDIVSGQVVSSTSNETDSSNNMNLTAFIQQNAGLQMPCQMMFLNPNITQSLLLQQQLQQLGFNNGTNNLLSNLISLNNINSTLGQQQITECFDPAIQMILTNQSNIFGTNLLTNVQNAIDSTRTDSVEVNMNGHSDSNNNGINILTTNVINNNSTNDVVVSPERIIQTSANNKVTNNQTLTTPNRLKQPMSKPPPKKPLTPYMIFSKQVWRDVKESHQHLSSVCEIGAIVGRMWRDLDATEKLKYNDLYFKGKERYEVELQEFFKETGMTPSDLVKPRAKRSSAGVKICSLQSHGQTINQITAQISQLSDQQPLEASMTSAATATPTSSLLSTAPLAITPLVIAPETSTISETSSITLPLNTVQPQELPQLAPVDSSLQQMPTNMTLTTNQQQNVTSLVDQDLFEQLGLTVPTVFQNGEYVYSIDPSTLALLALQQQQQQQPQQQIDESISNETKLNNTDSIEDDVNNNSYSNSVNQVSNISSHNIKKLDGCNQSTTGQHRLHQPPIMSFTVAEQSSINNLPTLYSSNVLSIADNDFINKFVLQGTVSGISTLNNNNSSSTNNNNSSLNSNNNHSSSTNSNNNNSSISIRNGLLRDDDGEGLAGNSGVAIECKWLDLMQSQVQDHNYVTKVLHNSTFDNSNKKMKTSNVTDEDNGDGESGASTFKFNCFNFSNNLVASSSSSSLLHGTCSDLM